MSFQQPVCCLRRTKWSEVIHHHFIFVRRRQQTGCWKVIILNTFTRERFYPFYEKQDVLFKIPCIAFDFRTIQIFPRAGSLWSIQILGAPAICEGCLSQVRAPNEYVSPSSHVIPWFINFIWIFRKHSNLRHLISILFKSTEKRWDWIRKSLN